MTNMTRTSAAPAAAEREQFDRDGFLIIRGALTPDEVCTYQNALDQAHQSAQADGR
ncbi:MAG: hypothetical protein JWM19_595, partial [Actinomycetia bacterium]|nr:hypothetical protein [Actinomycetes bacterium]